jgi:hypothetical protein
MIVRQLAIAFLVAGSAQAAETPQGLVELCEASTGPASLGHLVDAGGLWRNSDGLLTEFWFQGRMGVLFMEGMMPLPTLFSPINVDEKNSVTTLQALLLGDTSKSQIWALRQNWNEDRSGFSLTLDAPGASGPIHYSFVRAHIAKKASLYENFLNGVTSQCDEIKSKSPPVK